MKDSGIASIGCIPSDWEIGKVKYVFFRKKASSNDKNPTVLSLARSGVKVRDISNNFGQLAANYEGYNLVSPGDLLLNPMDLYSGANCSISQVSGVISPAYINLGHYKNTDPRFYDYFFKTLYWNKTLFSYGKGVSFDNRWTLSYSTLKDLAIPMPNYSEQQVIADYLDEKTKEIDNAIEKTQKTIELYKEYKKSLITETVTKGLDPNTEMKDSGITWLDHMPKKWTVKRGKNILTLLKRPVKKDDGVVTCFRDGEVTLRSNRREKGFTNSLKEIGYQGVEPGDLVVHGMDGFAGAIGISDSRGKMSPIINIMDSTQNKKYLMYYLRAMAYCGVFLGLATGIRERSSDLRWAKIANFPFLVPSIEEQALIANFLDDKSVKIDQIIDEKKTFVKQLEAYKKYLIYEYVTGKKSVI